MSLTIEDINKIAKKKEIIYNFKDVDCVIIGDNQGHTNHIYKKTENGLYEEVKLDIQKMALKLAEGLDKVEFMKDVLKTMPVEQILELKDLLPQPKTEVRSKGGCFNLIVSGEGGKKSRIVLR
jgi:hypothetical protein